MSNYDLVMLQIRLREVQDECYKLRRDLEEVRRMAEETERKCQEPSSLSPE